MSISLAFCYGLTVICRENKKVNGCLLLTWEKGKKMWHKIMRVMVFLFGYPSQDWPPGKEALKAYDADYARLHSGKPVTYHPFLEDPVTVYPKVKS